MSLLPLFIDSHHFLGTGWVVWDYHLFQDTISRDSGYISTVNPPASPHCQRHTLLTMATAAHRISRRANVRARRRQVKKQQRLTGGSDGAYTIMMMLKSYDHFHITKITIVVEPRFWCSSSNCCNIGKASPRSL